ncbi:hypothetical protein O988_04662 [Pseudogymnoascus sp. VKM F-3808]|nr:hypothetical protein O988_04662 [Pseudogymnoascus sp. VKM F-3808]
MGKYKFLVSPESNRAAELKQLQAEREATMQALSLVKAAASRQADRVQMSDVADVQVSNTENDRAAELKQLQAEREATVEDDWELVDKDKSTIPAVSNESIHDDESTVDSVNQEHIQDVLLSDTGHRLDNNLNKTLQFLAIEGDPKRNAVSRDTLLQAIRERQETFAIELVERGADPNAEDSYGFALTQAIREGYVKVASKLLEYGASPSAEDSYGFALTQAIRAGQETLAIELVERARHEKLEKELLEHGAITSPLMQESSGSTKLTYGGTSGRTMRYENITSPGPLPSAYRRNYPDADAEESKHPRAIQILGAMTEAELLGKLNDQMKERQNYEDANNDEDLRKLSATILTAKNSGSADSPEQKIPKVLTQNKEVTVESPREKRASTGNSSDNPARTDPVRFENIQTGPGGVYVDDISTPTHRIQGSFPNEAEFRVYLDEQHAEQNFKNKYGAGHSLVKD